MPFDGADFPARPEQPRRGGGGDTMATVIIVALAVCLLVLPISMGALIDVVHYLRG